MGDATGERASATSYAGRLGRLVERSAALLTDAGATDLATDLLSVTAQAADVATVVEHIPAGVLVADERGRVLLVNRAWRRMWGAVPAPSAHVPDHAVNAFRLRDPQSGRALTPEETPLARALRGETVQGLEFLAVWAGENEERWMSASAAPRRDPSGRLTGAVVLFSDITRERRLQAEVATASERLRTVYTAAVCGLMIVDRRGFVLDANDAAREILCAEPGQEPGSGQVTGERASRWGMRLPDGRPLPLTERPGSVAMRTGRPQRAVLVQLLRARGEPRWLQIDAVPVRDAYGRAEQAVVSFVDVTERVRAEEALASQALHDGLTELPNRTLLHDRMGQALRTAAREGGSLALLLIDLDRFKEINDTLGHHYGDDLLRQVAARLRRLVRDADTVARLGGDEFAVLLPGATKEGAIAVARAMLRALDEPFGVEGHDLDAGASIGIAVYPDHGREGQALLRRADVAMYVAKRGHTGHAVYDPAQDEHSPHRLALAADLRRALAEGALDLHYQPLVDLARGRVTGVEALARWRHPTHGPVPPDQFIPLAEGTGAIVPLTRWVLEASLRQQRAWKRRGLALDVAINISTRVLHDDTLPDTVRWLLHRYRAAPGAVTLEITESTLMANPARAMGVLTRLGGLGVKIAIDDFGTGYSSLGYLKDLPVDVVKIDKSFVRGLDMGDTGDTGSRGGKDGALVRSIIAMAHALELRVVAEGVEGSAAYAMLRDLGCDLAQGYYLSRPLPAPELERWVGSSPWRTEECPA